MTGLVAHCPANNCSEIFDKFQEGRLYLSGYYYVQGQDGQVSGVYCDREIGQQVDFNRLKSCAQIKKLNLPSGVYTIIILLVQ